MRKRRAVWEQLHQLVSIERAIRSSTLVMKEQIHLGRRTKKRSPLGRAVRTPILSHNDLACNASYHFEASRTVFPRVPPYLARDRLRLLAHIYDSVASIHMTENLGRHD